jgi:predicted AlkP superfamily pyrophosphatase or phosphodiesterase
MMGGDELSGCRVVLVLIDGLCPDGLREASTPVIDGLAVGGFFDAHVRTVMPSISLPCITSLITGVSPAQHGVLTNEWLPSQPLRPGLFDLVHAAGGSAASFYNWEPLRDLSRPGALTASWFRATCDDPLGGGDRELTEAAADWLRASPSTLTFVYLGNADVAGHAYGWMSKVYLEAVANADRCVGRVLECVDERTVVLVTSDHGGHEQVHGTDCPEDMTVPWVIAGPGVDVDHTSARPISILDVAPTVLSLLGIQVPSGMTGAPVAVAGHGFVGVAQKAG